MVVSEWSILFSLVPQNEIVFHEHKTFQPVQFVCNKWFFSVDHCLFFGEIVTIFMRTPVLSPGHGLWELATVILSHERLSLQLPPGQVLGLGTKPFLLHHAHSRGNVHSKIFWRLPRQGLVIPTSMFLQTLLSGNKPSNLVRFAMRMHPECVWWSAGNCNFPESEDTQPYHYLIAMWSQNYVHVSQKFAKPPQKYREKLIATRLPSLMKCVIFFCRDLRWHYFFVQCSEAKYIFRRCLCIFCTADLCDCGLCDHAAQSCYQVKPKCRKCIQLSGDCDVTKHKILNLNSESRIRE